MEVRGRNDSIMSTVSYSTVILGAGAIAAGYDSPESNEILTHAHAIAAHPRFSQLGFVDPDPARCEASARKWSTRSFATLSDVQTPVDVIAICAPTTLHLSCFRQAIERKPRLIVLEKPIAYSSNDRAVILELAKQASISTVVHYTRRFAPGLMDLSRRIHAGEFGSLLAGNAYYTKGWQNNGSHLVDLLRMLLGEPSTAHSMGRFVDHSADDLNEHVVFHFKEAPVTVLAGRETLYSEFTATFLFEKAKIEILDFGFRYRIQNVIPDPVFPNYRCLEANATEQKTGLDRSVYQLYDQIAEILDRGTLDLSGLFSADRTEDWLNRARSGENS